MGLVWSLSALVATIAVVLVFGAIINKAREKRDSPLYRLINKFKRKKDENLDFDQDIHYKRLSHKSGVKW
jgi:hypothetical protein